MVAQSSSERIGWAMVATPKRKLNHQPAGKALGDRYEILSDIHSSKPVKLKHLGQLTHSKYL
jgi:hypothetical protein